MTTYRSEPLSRWLESIRGYPVLGVEEEEELWKRWKAGEAGVRDRIVCGNQRFLLAAAKTYTRDPDLALELIQEGNIGLMDALERYDPTIGTRFLSYAIHHIRRRMSDYLRENGLVRKRLNSNIESVARSVKREWMDDNGFEIPQWILVEIVSEELGKNFWGNGACLEEIKVMYDGDLSVDGQGDLYSDSYIEVKTCVQNSAVGELEREDERKVISDMLDQVCQNEMERDVFVRTRGLLGYGQLAKLELARKWGLNEWQVEYVGKKIEKRLEDLAAGKKLKKTNRSKLQSGMVGVKAEGARTKGRLR